jgi:hypothetical protein
MTNLMGYHTHTNPLMEADDRPSFTGTSDIRARANHTSTPFRRT